MAVVSPIRCRGHLLDPAAGEVGAEVIRINGASRTETGPQPGHRPCVTQCILADGRPFMNWHKIRLAFGEYS